MYICDGIAALFLLVVALLGLIGLAGWSAADERLTRKQRECDRLRAYAHDLRTEKQDLEFKRNQREIDEGFEQSDAPEADMPPKSCGF